MPDLSIVDEICRFVATGVSDKSPSQLLSAVLSVLDSGYSQYQLFNISRTFLVFKEKESGTDVNCNSLMIALAIKFPCYCSKYWGTLMVRSTNPQALTGCKKSTESSTNTFI